MVDKNILGNAANIVFEDNADFCTWKGNVTTEDFQLKHFGIYFHLDPQYDIASAYFQVYGSLTLDGTPKLYVTGNNYQDCVSNYIKFHVAHGSDDNKLHIELFEAIVDICPMDPNIKISELIAFDLDLVAYYHTTYPNSYNRTS